MSGSESRDPAVSLSTWLRRFSEQITDESRLLIQNHVETVSQEIQFLAQQAALGNLQRRVKTASRPAQAPPVPASNDSPAIVLAALCVELMSSVLTSHIPCEIYLPRARTHAFVALIKSLLANEGYKDNLRGTLFALLPKLFLSGLRPADGTRSRPHQRQRQVETRIARARDGHWDELLQQALTFAVDPSSPPPECTSTTYRARKLQDAIP